MSHFTVVVFLHDASQLEKALAPFSEHLEVPASKEEIQAGKHIKDTYNPNSQWDFWTIGGNWTGEMDKDKQRDIMKASDVGIDFIPRSFIAPDGEWHGTWGKTEDEWKQQFREACRQYASLSATLVDCHI